MSAANDSRATDLEEGSTLRLDFGRVRSSSGVGVIPVAVQDVDSGQVLIIGHVNEAAVAQALRTRLATFWSISRGEVWVKGLTSGNRLILVDVRVNCEQNSVLYLVRLEKGGACHTKGSDGNYRLSCFYRRVRDGQLESVEPA